MTNDMSGLDQAPVPCFLSYAQIDDAVLGFVEAFRRDLAAYCFADHGLRIEVFLDRESIGWGEEWRTGIDSAIEGALVFLPLVTLTYFERPYCREELLQFYGSARTLGVTGLLLPVLVLGHQRILGASDDTAVRIIAERQGFDFREAALAGPGTREWRTTMVRLAARLVAAVDRAEGRLAAPLAPKDLGELAEQVLEDGRELRTAVGDLADAIRAFGQNLPSRPLMAKGHNLERSGSAMEAVAMRLDSAVRDYHAAVAADGSPAVRERLRADLSDMREQISAADQAAAALARMLESLRPIEAVSAPMRQALNPARSGLRAALSAVGIVQSWTVLD